MFHQIEKPLIMGILNVTPDSFSDGGDFLGGDAAIAHARKMVEEGAAIIDIGGESSRPGAAPVSAEQQQQRVLPIIQSLKSIFDDDIDISIDARVPAVADAAISAGASIINDISGGSDPEMFAVAAEHGVPIVLMHMQGDPQTMQQEPHYEDVVAEISEYLVERAEQAISAGVAARDIILDPGIGFGKNRAHNLGIMANLASFVQLGYTTMLGTSRKRFMGAICRETVFKELSGATCATTVLGVLAGVDIFRVHDVRENRQAMEVAQAILDAR